MQRAYHRFFSSALGRDMELLHFGTSGVPLLAFPASMGRFYQWEDFGLVAALAEWIDGGTVQILCVDGVDAESWLAKNRPPAERVARHLQYERYIVEEVLPGMPVPPLACGPSLGALQAVLLALRHPARFRGFIAMSGAFDTARWLDGYHDDSTYFTNPLAFLPNLTDKEYLEPLRAMRTKAIATGEEDPTAEDSRKLAALLHDVGVDVKLDLWPGWAHDWAYWKDMMRRYLAK